MSAQRTWIVDAANGRGTDFTKIQPAVTAASAGDTILVRRGAYQGFNVSKGVRILAAPSVSVRVIWTGSGYTKIVVSRLPKNETLVLRGFRVWSSNTQHRFLEIADCLGGVHLDSLFMDSISPSADWVIYVQRSRAVTLHRCYVRNGIRIEASTVMATTSDFTDGWSLLPPGPAIDATKSSVTLAGCSAFGGFFPNFFAYPAVVMNATRLRILGDKTSTYKAGNTVSYGVAAVVGDAASRLELDPRVTLIPHNNAPRHVGFGSVTTKSMPFLSMNGDVPLGGTVELVQHGSAGDPFALWLGLPVPPTSGPIGDLWLDSRLAILLAVGIHSSTGIARFRLTVPWTPTLRGLALAWQAIGGPLTGLAWTNAIVATVH